MPSRIVPVSTPHGCGRAARLDRTKMHETSRNVRSCAFGFSQRGASGMILFGMQRESDRHYQCERRCLERVRQRRKRRGPRNHGQTLAVERCNAGTPVDAGRNDRAVRREDHADQDRPLFPARPRLRRISFHGEQACRYPAGIIGRKLRCGGCRNRSRVRWRCRRLRRGRTQARRLRARNAGGRPRGSGFLRRRRGRGDDWLWRGRLGDRFRLLRRRWSRFRPGRRRFEFLRDGYWLRSHHHQLDRDLGPRDRRWGPRHRDRQARHKHRGMQRARPCQRRNPAAV